MRTLITGDSRPVEPDAVLVRGGLAKPSDLRRAVEKSQALFGVPALSVYVGSDVDTAVRDARLLNRVVRVARAAAVHGAGWRVYYTFTWPHASLVLPDDTDATLASFAVVFAEVVDNPYAAPSWR